MKYQVVCSDLDGTLLDGDGRLASENAAAISRLRELGVLFVPSTGRTVAELPAEIKSSADVRYIMYSNGAGLVDRETGVRSERLISAEKAAEIYRALEAFDLLIVFHKDAECYADARRLDRAENYTISSAYANVFECGIRIENDFDSYKYSVGAVEMICIFLGKAVSRVDCVAALAGIEGITVTTSGGGNIEIVSSAAGKGNGLRAFSKLAGISCENMICVGDSLNDASMLDEAGLALAVANADEGLKPHADQVVCPNRL